MRELLLSDLAMLAEIPAPTFGEGTRIRLLEDRFTENGLQNVSIDDVGNGIAILPGADGGKNILVVAHADTVFTARENHTVTVAEDRVTGPGVGDNVLGLAVLATLPEILEHVGVRLRANLVLMGAVRSLGRGDLEGLRFFLSHAPMRIDAGICVEGVQLGRLSHTSIGMSRGQISVVVPEEYDWSRLRASGAVRVLNEVINRIAAIPIPQQPRTGILFGSVAGGTSFDIIPTHADLRFEIRSESDRVVDEIDGRIQRIAAEISDTTGSLINHERIARRQPGGIDVSHPIVAETRHIMTELGIQPRVSPSLSELCVFINRKIPALTLGITTGERLHETDETVRIAPIATGLAQLVAVLNAVDRWLDHDDR
jgi:acetylornithine deacetylase/succinyl-diaminopimelate desuccinylase-like protein